MGLIEYYERKSFGKHTNGSRLFLYKVTRNLMKLKREIRGLMNRQRLRAGFTFHLLKRGLREDMQWWQLAMMMIRLRLPTDTVKSRQPGHF